MKNSFSSITGALIFLIVLLAHSSNAFACACCFNGEVQQTFTLGARTDDLWAYPYGDQQAKGTLGVIEDTAKKILYEGGDSGSPTIKMAFTLRPFATGKAFDLGRWWLDIPSQGVSLRFEPAPKAQYIRSFEIQKGPRTPANKLGQEQEYKGIVTRKDQVNGHWIVVKDAKGMFKSHAKTLSGLVFLTASNSGSCISDFVSARVSVYSPRRADGGRPEANLELGGEAKNISAYAPELKP
jgi:hypothetical protein